MSSEDKGNILQTRIKNDEREIGFGFIIFGILLIIIIVNVLYLNYLLWQNSKSNNIQNQNIQTGSDNTSITPIPTTCIDCESQTPLPTNGSITQSPILQQTSSPNSLVKEYFIPLGSGTNTATVWTDVAGAEASINFSNYQGIKEVLFEASVTIPTSSQFVSVRLYNKTDKHPVWYSEVSTNGSASSYLTSQPVIYDTGTKIYQVQMKNQLSSVANLLQARLHIVLK